MMDEVQKFKGILVPNFDKLKQQRKQEVENILQVITKCLSKKELRKLSRKGLPKQTPLLRSHIWKMLLGTLDIKWQSWQSSKAKHLSLYIQLIEKEKAQHEDLMKLVEDKNYEKGEYKLWRQIELDTKRTYGEYPFFNRQITHTTILQITTNAVIMSRILFIWARINRTISYVQGMNEILAPLFYLEFSIPRKQSESQVFWMFSALMSTIVNLHLSSITKTQDYTKGMLNHIRMLTKYMKIMSADLWEVLQQSPVHLSYSFRWIALMMAQQFDIEGTICLWDMLLSFENPKRQFYLYCCCIALYENHRKIIMEEQLESILKVLSCRTQNAQEVIIIANRLYDNFKYINIDRPQNKIKYSSQKKEEKLKDSSKNCQCPNAIISFFNKIFYQ